MISIQLLGHPVLTKDNQPLIIQRRILRAMLFFLACQEEPVGRQDLFLLFWPDESEEKARRQVRDALSKLRSQLPNPDTVITIQDMVFLNPEEVEIDVRTFQQLARQIHNISQSLPFSKSMYQRMVEAVRLWRAPRFLAGADLPINGDFDEWVTNMQRSLENERHYLLERLSDHEIASGNLDLALQWLRAALENDPLNPPLHVKVLTCLESLGRLSEAVNHCLHVDELYHQEMQCPPPHEILEIGSRIQSQAATRSVKKIPYWPSPLSIPTPFVGHAPLLQVLKMAYARGGCVLLRGESGAGKTRIGYEMLHRMEPTPRLLMAVGRPLEITLPYQPLIDLLREVVRPREWDLLAPIWKQFLSNLMPELSDASMPAARLLQGSPEFNTRIYEALHQLFLILTREQRIIFFLDDAQWSDEASLAALAYMIERDFFSQHGLLMLAARVEETNPHLENLVLRIQRPRTITTFDVELLEEQEVLELSEHFLGYKPSSDMVLELIKNSGGNPLYILEMLHSLVPFSSLGHLKQTFQNLPGDNKLQVLVRARLGQTTPQAREILTTAAVIGNVFSLDLLEKTSSLEANPFTQAVEVLEKAHLIRPARHISPGGAYAFIHEKIREILLQELSHASQRAMHLRVACALENEGNDLETQAAIIAYHLEQSRQYPRAFHYWMISANHAWNLFSQTGCYLALENAEALLQQNPDEFSEMDIYQLYNRWGKVAGHFNDIPTLSLIYEKMKKLGEKRKSALLVGCALNGIGHINTMQNKTQKGLQYVKQAVLYLEKSGCVEELVEALSHLASFEYFLGHNIRAIEAFEKALQMSEGMDSAAIQHTRISCENMLALAQIQSGFPDKALETATHSLHLSEQLFFLHGITNAHSSIARAYFYLGQYSNALEALDKGLESAKTTQNQRMVCYLLNTTARVHLAKGNIDKAWNASGLSLQIGAENQFGEIFVESNGFQGDLFRMLNVIPMAIDHYQQGLFGGGSELQTLEIQYRLGYTILMHDPLQFDECLLKDVLTKSSQNGLMAIYFATQISMASYFLSSQQIDLANQTIQQVEEAIQGYRLATTPLVLQITKGNIALKNAQPDRAFDCAQKVIELSRRLSNPFSELGGIGLAAGALKMMGQKTDALTDRAVELLDGIAQNTQNPIYQPYFEQYRQNFLHRVG